MLNITEQFERLEQDGKQYAHFLTHPQNPDHYGIWVRERTPEYVKLWLPHSTLQDYNLAFSIEMPDAAFCDYVAELYPNQVQARYLKMLYHIEGFNLNAAIELANNFRNWKQEEIRLNRVKWLEQYPWVVKSRIGR